MRPPVMPGPMLRKARPASASVETLGAVAGFSGVFVTRGGGAAVAEAAHERTRKDKRERREGAFMTPEATRRAAGKSTQYAGRPAADRNSSRERMRPALMTSRGLSRTERPAAGSPSRMSRS